MKSRAFAVTERGLDADSDLGLFGSEGHLRLALDALLDSIKEVVKSENEPSAGGTCDFHMRWLSARQWDGPLRARWCVAMLCGVDPDDPDQQDLLDRSQARLVEHALCDPRGLHRALSFATNLGGDKLMQVFGEMGGIGDYSLGEGLSTLEADAGAHARIRPRMQ